MEIRHLRYFVALADELHFGRAAQKLGIRQPPLSQQIRALEASLGVSLFHRTSRRVELTAAGQALLPAARHLLTSAAAAQEAAQYAGRGETGQLVLGFVGSATASLLPSAPVPSPLSEGDAPTARADHEPAGSRVAGGNPGCRAAPAAAEPDRGGRHRRRADRRGTPDGRPARRAPAGRRTSRRRRATRRRTVRVVPPRARARVTRADHELLRTGRLHAADQPGSRADADHHGFGRRWPRRLDRALVGRYRAGRDGREEAFD